jgi:N-acetyl-gamma-glutamyl-phosphate reductase
MYPRFCKAVTQLQQLMGEIDFIPYRGDFPRGIFCTEVIKHPIQDEIDDRQGYKDFYRSPFTHYVDQPLDLKQVVNTNKALVHCDIIDDKLLVTSCIDNLLKGAVGQAVENMNLMFGLEESTGLRLKSVAF